MTYPLSSPVVPGDPTAAAHYNNLRADALHMGQASADAVTLGTLLKRYESGVLLERLGTDRVRLVASATAPVSLMVDAYMVHATTPIDLPEAGKLGGPVSIFYIFANRSDDSTSLTLSVSTSPTELENQRRIGRFYWDGGKIVKDSVRTEQAVNIKSQLYFEEPHICDGRLTASTGVPVPVTPVDSSSFLFFTPYIGNRVSLYVPGYGWRVYTFSELVLDISSATINKNFDVWIYDDAGTIKLTYSEWSNDTLRATALTYLDGIPLKANSLDHRYLGTFRTSGAGSLSDSLSKRFLWNYHNRVYRPMRVIETGNWSYSSTDWRQANNKSVNKIEFLIGIHDDIVQAIYQVGHDTITSTRGCQVGFGLDKVNELSPDACASFAYYATGSWTVNAHYIGSPGIGYHYLAAIERAANNNPVTFYADWGNNNLFFLSGLIRG